MVLLYVMVALPQMIVRSRDSDIVRILHIHTLGNISSTETTTLHAIYIGRSTGGGRRTSGMTGDRWHMTGDESVITVCITDGKDDRL